MGTVEPLIPVVRWMVERPGSFSRFVQRMTLDVPADITRSQVVATLAAVVDQHDALRSRLWPSEDGTWLWEISAPGSVNVDALLTEATGDVNTAVDVALDRLDPASGVVLQFVWMTDVNRLIVLAHHLVVDGVSWRIIVPDLISSWLQVKADSTVSLPAVGTSVRRWAHGLAETAQTPEVVAELPYWKSVVNADDPALGARSFDPALDTSDTVESLRVRVDSDTTEVLLTTVPGLFHTGANEVFSPPWALPWPSGVIATASRCAWRATVARSPFCRRGHQPHGRVVYLDVPGSSGCRGGRC